LPAELAFVNCKYAGDADDTTAAFPNNVHPPAVGLGTLVVASAGTTKTRDSRLATKLHPARRVSFFRTGYLVPGANK
jgi:hypothetical protein